MLTPSSPCDCGAVGELRIATSMVPHSTTSKSMSIPTSLKFCCMNFIFEVLLHELVHRDRHHLAGARRRDHDLRLHGIAGAVAGVLQQRLGAFRIIRVAI